MGGPVRLSSQTWTAFVCAALFVALAAVLILVPVPYVTWSPGRTYDVLSTAESAGDGAAASKDGPPVLEITGAKTYDTPGSLVATTVSVTTSDSRLSLPEALLGFFLPSRDTLPRAAVYQANKSVDEIEAGQATAMTSSQDEAIVAALRQAEQPVRELPMVASITLGAPAEGQLQSGDLVTKINGGKATSARQIDRILTGSKVGDKLTISVLRDDAPVDVTVATVASNDDPRVPVIGVTWSTGFDFEPDISVNLDPRVGGPSAGLVFALGVYDKLTPAELIGSRTVAGTGTLTAEGRVGAIGGAKEKLHAAQQRGATLFLLPKANCVDLGQDNFDIPVFAVETLDDAVQVLKRSGTGADLDSLEQCPR